MTKKREHTEYWCPFGRISLQHVDNKGGTQAVSTGAFNIAVVTSAHTGINGTVYHSSKCIGENCPLFDTKAKSNFCLCAKKGVGKHIVFAAFLIALSIISASLLLCFGAVYGTSLY